MFFSFQNRWRCPIRLLTAADAVTAAVYGTACEIRAIPLRCLAYPQDILLQPSFDKHDQFGLFPLFFSHYFYLLLFVLSFYTTIINLNIYYSAADSHGLRRSENQKVGRSVNKAIRNRTSWHFFPWNLASL